MVLSVDVRNHGHRGLVSIHRSRYCCIKATVGTQYFTDVGTRDGKAVGLCAHCHHEQQRQKTEKLAFLHTT